MALELKLFIYWLIMTIASRLFFEISFFFSNGGFNKKYALKNDLRALPYQILFCIGGFGWIGYLLFIFTKWFFE